MYFGHWNNCLIWIMLHFVGVNFCPYLDMSAIRHAQTRTHLLGLCRQLSWPTSSPIKQQHKNLLLLLSSGPGCWCRVWYFVGSWGLDMCFCLLVFRLLWVFAFLTWVLDRGLGTAASSNLSFCVLPVPLCPLFSQLSLLPLSLSYSNKQDFLCSTKCFLLL